MFELQNIIHMEVSMSANTVRHRIGPQSTYRFNELPDAEQEKALRLVAYLKSQNGSAGLPAKDIWCAAEAECRKKNSVTVPYHYLNRTDERVHQALAYDHATYG
jgi:hypothetical protein